VRLEWDERKNQENLRKHGLAFHEAAEIFDSPMLVRRDDRKEYGEDRWIALGVIRGLVVVMVFTERDKGQVTRIISLRKALRHERQGYEKFISH
jgi:uncharacterized DUF497 family protein